MVVKEKVEKASINEVEINTKPKKDEYEVQRSPHIGRSARLGTCCLRRFYTLF
jgi:hypothetical protein